MGLIAEHAPNMRDYHRPDSAPLSIPQCFNICITLSKKDMHISQTGTGTESTHRSSSVLAKNNPLNSIEPYCLDKYTSAEDAYSQVFRF